MVVPTPIPAPEGFSHQTGTGPCLASAYSYMTTSPTISTQFFNHAQTPFPLVSRSRSSACSRLCS